MSGGGEHGRQLRSRRRVVALEFTLERSATSMVQAVDRALSASQSICDLARREADDVAQDHDLALILRKRAKRVANHQPVLEIGRGVDF